MAFLEDSNSTDQFDRTEVVVGDKDDRAKKQAVDSAGSAQVGLANPAGTKITSTTAGAKVAMDVSSNIQVGNLDVTATNRVPTTDILNIGFSTAEKTSTSTRSIARVGAVNLVGRKAIEIVNTSTVALYVGDATVTTTGSTRGRPIDPKSSFAVDLAANVDLYIISASNATYVVTEVG